VVPAAGHAGRRTRRRGRPRGHHPPIGALASSVSTRDLVHPWSGSPVQCAAVQGGAHHPSEAVAVPQPRYGSTHAGGTCRGRGPTTLESHPDPEESDEHPDHVGHRRPQVLRPRPEPIRRAPRRELRRPRGREHRDRGQERLRQVHPHAPDGPAGRSLVRQDRTGGRRHRHASGQPAEPRAQPDVRLRLPAVLPHRRHHGARQRGAADEDRRLRTSGAGAASPRSSSSNSRRKPAARPPIFPEGRSSGS
jgi:hypothetical protein